MKSGTNCEIEETKFEGFLQELINENEVRGKIQGGLYLPQRFLEKQPGLLKSYFEKNGYIDYNFVKTAFYAMKPKVF